MPLIFWGPGHVAAGKVVDGTVQLIDVMPTLIELAGLRPPAGMQGRSLASVLRAGAPSAELPPRPAISEKFAQLAPWQRSIRYRVTPTASKEALQERLIWLEPTAPAARFVGSVGAVVSGGASVVAEARFE